VGGQRIVMRTWRLGGTEAVVAVSGRAWSSTPAGASGFSESLCIPPDRGPPSKPETCWWTSASRHIGSSSWSATAARTSPLHSTRS